MSAVILSEPKITETVLGFADGVHEKWVDMRGETVAETSQGERPPVRILPTDRVPVRRILNGN